MGREWVPFLKEEIDELYQLAKSVVGNTFPDELIYRLIDIVESATFVEIDFGELLQCLAGCKSGYKVFESKEALDMYTSENPGDIKYMLAYRAYDVRDTESSMDNFVLWAKDINSLTDDEGHLVLSCSFTEDEGSDFYLISIDENS